MFPQKNGVGKTAVFVISIITIIFVLAGLSLTAAQNQTNHFNYLPIILQDGSPPPPITPTSTPAAPYLVLQPNCDSGPNVRFTVQGFNWPKNETITLYWDSVNLQSTIFTGDSTSFSQSWTKWGLANDTYEIIATSAGHMVSAVYHVPCPTNTPTATPTNTPTQTPGPTATPDYCGLEFEDFLIAGNDFVYVTGEIGRIVTIIDVTTGRTLGTGTLLDRTDHACPGFLSVALNSPLIAAHLILAESDNVHDQYDTAWVLSEAPAPTSTNTPSPTATPDFCGPEFSATPITGFDYVEITGEIGRFVTITDLTTTEILGSGELIESNISWSNCPGFASVTLNEYLVEGHLLLVQSNNPYDSFDTAWVSLPPPLPTPGVTPSPTQTPTPTPTGPFIVLHPACGSPPNVQFTVQGFNWPQDETIALYWESGLQSIINTGSQTSFSQTWQKLGIGAGSYEVKAVSANHTATAVFTAPCPVPPSITPTATATAVSGPANLTIGQPILISTPPIIAYQPVDFQVIISNTATTPVDSQFFVDIFIDPTTILTNSIPINQSDGYQGISSIAGLATRVITISAPLGFSNEPEQHSVYGMVDSLSQINESDETDNISEQLIYDQTTPPPTATPVVTVEPSVNNITGIVYRPSDKGLTPLLRASVLLVETDSSNIIAATMSDPLTGVYHFDNLAQTTYMVMACGSMNTAAGIIEYFGWRTGITLPYLFPVNVYTSDSISCPPQFP